MSPTHPWPSSVGYTTYGYIILLVYIIWKYNLLKLIFFDNVEVYFYIEVGLSTSNEESKGETLRHMTWAKAQLMVVGGLILVKGPPNGRWWAAYTAHYRTRKHYSLGIVYTTAALWFLNPDLTESEWPANWTPTRPVPAANQGTAQEI